MLQVSVQNTTSIKSTRKIYINVRQNRCFQTKNITVKYKGQVNNFSANGMAEKVFIFGLIRQKDTRHKIHKTLKSSKMKNFYSTIL